MIARAAANTLTPDIAFKTLDIRALRWKTGVTAAGYSARARRDSYSNRNEIHAS
jgi:hypothetical protein